jgi:signal transduction histidine kinase
MSEAAQGDVDCHHTGAKSMVDIIASRAAGLRLTWIIAALMVPIAFLGYFMFNTLRLERAVAQREADGAQLQKLLIPLYMGAAADIVDGKIATDLLEHGEHLAKNIGLSTAYSNLVDMLAQPKPYPGAVLANTRELMNLNAQQSGMILDMESETYFLAAVSSQAMPKLVSDFKTLQNSAKMAVAESSKNTDGLSQLLLDTGRLASAGELAIADINMAARSTNDGSAYAEMGKISSSIRSRISNFGNAIRKNFLYKDPTALLSFFQSTKYVTPILSEYQTLWSFSNDRFSKLLDQRLTLIAKKIMTLLTISAAAIMLGLGLAFKMFQSTLKRLDDVEHAKQFADLARIEAENMSEKMGIVNDNMVSMNQELARNMDMLKDAQDALVKKGRMEQMGQLTATIAHELRNPLGAVRTSAFLIERKIKDKGLGIEQQLLRINNGITRCDGIITQLLDFSRTKQLAAREGDLDQWLATTIEEEAKSLPAAVSIQCHLGLNGIQVPFDPDRLQRAIINLIGNASEAMVGNGEDPSRFTVANPQISISSALVGRMIEITISDNGPGISAENLGKIREPLFTTKSFGTGLGIPAVEQIAHQHGGSLEIKSEIGMGAAFTIKLPRITPREVAA